MFIGPLTTRNTKLRQARHARRHLVAGPRIDQHGADFEETGPEPLDAADADAVLVEAGGDADAVAERQPAPGERVGRRVGEAVGESEDGQPGGVGELGRQAFKSIRPDVEHCDIVPVAVEPGS